MLLIDILSSIIIRKYDFKTPLDLRRYMERGFLWSRDMYGDVVLIRLKKSDK